MTISSGMITVKNENGIFLVEENNIISESSNHVHIDISNRIVREENEGIFIEYIRPLEIWCKKHLTLVDSTKYKPLCCKD
jgi:hypothetical protein